MAEFVQIRISLNNILPKIWRRIIVRGDINLHELHGLLQGAMGWEAYHLYNFVIDDKCFELQDEENEFKNGTLDTRTVSLDKAIRVGQTALYSYDFGDGWEHTVTRERLTCKIPNVLHTGICLAGENACPPEDVGGEIGYESYLQALRTGKGAAYRETVAWRGKFDPALFSPVQATQAMNMIVAIMSLSQEGFE